MQLLLYALRSPFFDRYTRCAAAAPAACTHTLMYSPQACLRHMHADRWLSHLMRAPSSRSQGVDCFLQAYGLGF